MRASRETEGGRFVDGEQKFDEHFEQCSNSLRLIAKRVLEGAEEVDNAMRRCSDATAGQRRRFANDGEFRSWLVRTLLSEALMILHERQSGSEDEGVPICSNRC